MNIIDFRSQFPILRREINGLPLIFLDNAATTQKPQILLDSLVSYYSTYNSNIHRGIYTLAEESTRMYEEARTKVMKFLGLTNRTNLDVVFTKGDTEGANIVANALPDILSDGSEILVSDLDHHSVLLPFKLQNKFTVNFIPRNGFEVDFIKLEKYLSENNIGLIAISVASNVTGRIVNLRKLYELKNKYGFKLFLDAAQLIPHMVSDSEMLQVQNNSEATFDFLVFSAHKVMGPTGVGALILDKSIASKMRPLNLGGSMINSVTYAGTEFQESPYKFEGGTPNIADVIAFGSVLDWIRDLDRYLLSDHLAELHNYFISKMRDISEIEWLDQGTLLHETELPIFTFNIKGIHPHDIADFLNNYNICIRAGQHCTGLLHESLGLVASTRVSLYYYNSKEEIDILAEKLRLLISKFS